MFIDWSFISESKERAFHEWLNKPEVVEWRASHPVDEFTLFLIFDPVPQPGDDDEEAKEIRASFEAWASSDAYRILCREEAARKAREYALLSNPETYERAFQEVQSNLESYDLAF